MQTPEGVIKAKETMRRKYGLTEDGRSAFHVEVGAIGGRNGKTGGLYGDPERASKIGSVGGAISKRGHKFIKEENGLRYYIEKKTGRQVTFKVVD